LALFPNGIAFGQVDLPEDVGLVALDIEPRAARIHNISKGSARTQQICSLSTVLRTGFETTKLESRLCADHISSDLRLFKV
jgi:hypothetical protein